MMKSLLLSFAAVSAEDNKPFIWPAQAPWSGRSWCGAQQVVNVQTNSTCTLTLNKGKAAWINTGGLFVTSMGTADTMYFHTYDGQGEAEKGSVPVTIVYQMTELPEVESIPFNKWGQPAYPQEWQADCYLARDLKNADPVDFSCQDNGGAVQGIYMSGFTFSNNGDGQQTVQIMNTDGHAAGFTYTLTLRSSNDFTDLPEVAIGEASTPANATVTVEPPNTIYVELHEEYLGELLPVNFVYADALENYQPYQAAWSEVGGVF